MGTGFTLKRFSKYANSIIFLFLLGLFLVLKSYTHFSTSLLSILPPSQEKSLLKHFEETQGAKTLLLAVKGFDKNALAKIQRLEKEFLLLENISENTYRQNEMLQKHLQTYALYAQDINQSKISRLNTSKMLQELYQEMTRSFFPVQINTSDPFSLFNKEKTVSIALKNGHLVLENYGYMSTFRIKSKTLKAHKELYTHIQQRIDTDNAIKVFSPIFYYVENSQVIRADVNRIMLISFGLLLLLYLVMLKNFALLFNTLLTLASSALFASTLLALYYDEISIFVFVFGISISTVAIDYMFHHYLHGYYAENKPYNKEVLFGFLTTISAFIILSFTSFVLIKQISLFAVFSLFASYVHFSFLYPKMRFRSAQTQDTLFPKHFYFLKTKPVFFFSLIVILASGFWVHFDFDIKNLDYDNKTLKETQAFFSNALTQEPTIPFAIKARSIDTLIDHAKEIRSIAPSVRIPLANLVSKKSYTKNTALLQNMSKLRETLKKDADTLGFKKGYFSRAYLPQEKQPLYTLQVLNAYGLDIFKTDAYYFAFGHIGLSHYQEIKNLYFVENLSLKERFESMMQESIDSILTLGILALCVILLLLYVITGTSMLYAVIFLLFPAAMISLYGLFFPFNILHIFMLFIILSIGVDYAIYLSCKNDLRAKQAISYSLLSTFAGFGVLVFSQMDALHSLGIIASIGIVSIFFLLLTLKRSDHAS